MPGVADRLFVKTLRHTGKCRHSEHLRLAKSASARIAGRASIDAISGCLIQQQLADQIAGKAPVFEETHPFGQFPALAHLTSTKLGIVYLPEQVTPFVPIDVQITADELLAYAPLQQLRADAHGALPSVDTALDKGLGEALVALQTGLLKLVEYLLQQILVTGVFAQLA